VDARQLPAQVIEGEQVVRERPTAWSLLLVALGWFIEASHHRSTLIVGLICLVVAACLTEVLLLPAHLVVGVRGIAVRQHGRTREFLWSVIESIELGNPGIPTSAYIVFKDGRRPMELPGFSNVESAELVALLEAKRRLYARG